MPDQPAAHREQPAVAAFSKKQTNKWIFGSDEDGFFAGFLAQSLLSKFRRRSFTRVNRIYTLLKKAKGKA